MQLLLELKFRLLLTLGKCLVMALKLFGSRGTALPGLVIEKLWPNFIFYARTKIKNAIAVTGTNGKTSTQTLLSNSLRDLYKKPVLVNSRGANLSRGLVSEVIKQYPVFGKTGFEYAVFEVEEATLPRIARQLNPDILVVTNFFRDQLDAYGEIERTKMHVRNAIAQLPKIKLVVNADDPHVLATIEGLDREVHAVRLSSYEDYLHYEPFKGGLPSISFSKEHVFPAAKINADYGAEFSFENVDFKLRLPGFYNYYSFAFCFATLALLDASFNAKLPDFARSIANCFPPFGRGEILHHIKGADELRLQFLLVKNPIGFNLVLDMLCSNASDFNLIILINDNIADGRDVSWLWDSELEKLNTANLKRVYLGGTRAKDMALRLKYALSKQIELTTVDGWEQLTQLAGDYKVITTYTAMNQFRDFLLNSGAKSESEIAEKTASSE